MDSFGNYLGWLSSYQLEVKKQDTLYTLTNAHGHDIWHATGCPTTSYQQIGTCIKLLAVDFSIYREIPTHNLLILITLNYNIVFSRSSV